MKHSARNILVVVATLVAFPAVAFASEEGGGPAWNELGAAIINFAIYVGIIVYFGGGPIKAFFAARRTTLTERIDAAGAARDEAKEILEQYTARLDGLAKEREELLANYEAMGERERVAIIEAAEKQAERMKTDAAATIEMESRRAAADLETRLVDRALDMAREKLAKDMDAAKQSGIIDAGIDHLTAA